MSLPDTTYLRVGPATVIKLHRVGGETGDRYLMLPEDVPPEWKRICPGPFHDAVRGQYESGVKAHQLASRYDVTKNTIYAWLLWTGARLRTKDAA